LSYEVLHKICALCGYDDPAMKYYPWVKPKPSLEEIVERFDAQTFTVSHSLMA